MIRIYYISLYFQIMKVVYNCIALHFVSYCILFVALYFENFFINIGCIVQKCCIFISAVNIVSGQTYAGIQWRI